jgi:hypothetical protein
MSSDMVKRTAADEAGAYKTKRTDSAIAGVDLAQTPLKSSNPLATTISTTPAASIATSTAGAVLPTATLRSSKVEEASYILRFYDKKTGKESAIQINVNKAPRHALR